VDWKLPLRMPHQEVYSQTPTATARILTKLERPEDSLGISQPSNFAPERRTSARFPLELPAELTAGKVKLKAKTANISSGGLLLSCESQQEVEVGTLVTVRLNWPIPQRSKQVVLVMHGEIIRRQASGVAIRHRRHEFEICPQPAVSRPQLSWQQHFTSLIPAFIS